MRIIIDSNEKKNQHILDYFDKHDIEYIRKPLYLSADGVGDYMIEGVGSISIERKRNLGELCGNLFSTASGKKSNFMKEIRKSRELGTKLYILCEHGGKVKSIQDVAEWSDKYSGVSGRALMEALYKLHIAWGVEVLFCSKRSTGRRIIEILTQGA